MKLTDTTIRNELDDLRIELASVKNTLDSIKKNSQDYIIRYNNDLRIEFASSSLCNALTIREEEIIGKGNIEIGIPASSAALWNSTMKNVMKTGRSKRVEFKLPYNGSNHFYEAVIVPEKSEKNNYENILCIVRDVTKKKKAEHQNKRLLKELELQKRELEEWVARDRILLNNLNEGIIISDPQGKLLYMNESSKCFHDIFKEADLKSNTEDQHSIYEFYKNENRIHFNDLPLQRTLRKEAFSDLEIRILNNHTGKTWYSNFSGSPVFDENGNFIFSILNIRDVTEKKNTESERENLIDRLKKEKKYLIESELVLKKTEERFHGMFDSHQAVMLIIDPLTGVIEDANKAAVKFYGYTKEQLLKMRIQEINILFPDEVEIERERAVKEERSYFVFPHKKANGQITWVEVYSSPFDISGKPMLFSIIHDISERKQYEVALNESRNDLNRAQSVTHIGSWRLDIIKNELTWSDEAYRIFNIPLGTPLSYERFLSFVHPEDIRTVENRWKAALLGDEYNIEHRIIVNDTVKWVRETAVLDFDKEGKLITGFGTVQDITKRKEIEKEREQLLTEVKLSEQKLTWALQAGKGGVWDWDHTTDTVWLSEELYKLYGIEAGTHVDYNYMLNILDDRDKERVLTALGDSIGNRTDLHCDMRIHHPEKGERWIDFHGRTFYDHSGIAVRTLGIALDITERKQNEETLRQYADSLNFLSGTATSMIEKLGSPELFRFISDSLYKVAGGSIVIFNEFDLLTNKLVVKEFRCSAEEKEQVIKIFGREPEGLSFDFPEEIRERIKFGQLDFLEGGIFELAFGQLPQTFCKDLEHELRISSVFAMACSVERDILGTVAVLSHEKSNILKNTQVIESVVNQAALALKRKRVEDDLRASEEKFAAAFNSSPNGIVLSTLEDGVVIDVNNSLLNLVGKSREDVIGKKTLEIDAYSNPVDREKLIEILIDKGKVLNYEMRLKGIGKELTVLTSVELLNTGNAKTLLTTIQDITERKEIENQLRKDRNFFETIYNSIPVMLTIYDPEVLSFSTNKHLETVTGWTNEDMTAQGAMEKVYPDPEYRQMVEEYIHSLEQGFKDLKMVCKDGSVKETSWSNIKIPDGRQVGIGIDITERRKAEEAVQESKAKLDAALASMTDAVSISDEEGNFIEFNDAFATFHKFRNKDECSKTFAEYPGILEIFYPDGTLAPVDMWAVPRALRGEKATNEIYELQRKDTGQTWTGSYSFAPIRNDGGKVVGSVVVRRDITALKKAQEEIIAKNNEIEAIIGSIGEGILVYDKEGRITRINEVSKELFGYPEHDSKLTIQERVSKYIILDEQGKVVNHQNMPAYRAAVLGEYVEGKIFWVEGLGKPHWLYMTSKPLFVSGTHAGGVTSLLDITSLKEAQLKITDQANLITAITEAVPDMISIIELPSRNLFYTNREPFSMQGFNAEQLQKMTKEERNELVHMDDREALSDYFNKLSKIENQENIILEYRARNFENKWMWFRARGRVFERHSDGTVKSCINVVQNITEQKIAEERLRESEQRLKAMFNNAAIGIVVTDSEDRFIEVNERLCEILGYSRQELTGKTVHELTAPEDRLRSDDFNAKLKKGKLKNFDYEKRYLKSDNTPLWVHVTVSSIRDSQGKHMISIGTVEDISKRREAEESLRSITDNSPVVIARLDRRLRHLFINPYGEKVYGKTKEEIIGKSNAELDMPQEKVSFWEKHFYEVWETGKAQNIEFEFESPSFGHQYFLSVLVPEKNESGEVISILAITRDITEIKRSEQKLRESEERLQAVFNNAAIGIVEVGAENRFTLVNNRMCEILGYRGEELIGKTVYEITYEDDRSKSAEMNEKIHRGELKSINYEKRYIKKDGTPVWVSISVSSVHDPNGKYLKSVGTVEDISDRKKIEEQLHMQAMMLEQVHDAIFATDNANRITYINKAAIKQYEIKDNEKIIRSKLGDYFSLEWLNTDQQRESLKSLMSKNVWKGENFFTTSKGKMFWADTVLSVTRDESGKRNGLVAVVRDISERKRLEEQLLNKNEHLIKVNELLEDFVHIAAHDLRGPIASLMMMSEFLNLRKTTEDKELAFSQIIPIVRKLQRTVDGLMETVNVQTKSEVVFKKVQFKDLYDDIMDDCASELSRYRVKMETDFSEAPDIDYVEAYLHSIIKNLITNAMKYSAEVENPLVHISTKKEKDHILFIVKDNGIGIDIEKAGENLFKPFKRFTSKAEGTGMGLYIIKNIIEKNGGHITVESKPNEGTTFYCFLKEYTISL